MDRDLILIHDHPIARLAEQSKPKPEGTSNGSCPNHQNTTDVQSLKGRRSLLRTLAFLVIPAGENSRCGLHVKLPSKHSRRSQAGGQCGAAESSFRIAKLLARPI